MSKSRLVSGKVKKVSHTLLDTDRYDFLDLANAEPDLGRPTSDGSFLLGDANGDRYWSDSVDVNFRGDVFTNNIFSEDSDSSQSVTIHPITSFNSDVTISGNLTVQGITISESLFENLSISGGLEVTGNSILPDLYTTSVRSIEENGTITVYSLTTIDKDLTVNETLKVAESIEIAYDAINGAGANGLGIKILGPTTPTTLLYNSATDRLEINKTITGSISDVDVDFAKSKEKVEQVGADPLDLLIFYQNSTDQFKTVSVQDVTGGIGFTGSQGDIGYTGSQGPIGYTGSEGTAGVDGTDGIDGFTGSAGFTGSLGYTGSQGFTGSQGDVGFVGSTGFTGSAGFTGSVGFTGSRGDLGYTGSQGDIGYVGSRGANGNRSVMLAQEGLLVVRIGVVRWYAPAALTISEITFRLTDPADQLATIVINKNGVATRTLIMPIGQTKVSNTTAFSMAEDDYLTVDVTSSGTPGLTTQGSGLNVTFLYQFTNL